MKTYIFKELIAEGFTSLGKNNIQHIDLLEAFERKQTGHYTEVYKEIYGFSIIIYGEGLMNGYYPTIFDITEQKDVKLLRNKIKTVFSKKGLYT